MCNNILRLSHKVTYNQSDKSGLQILQTMQHNWGAGNSIYTVITRNKMLSSANNNMNNIEPDTKMTISVLQLFKQSLTYLINRLRYFWVRSSLRDTLTADIWLSLLDWVSITIENDCHWWGLNPWLLQWQYHTLTTELGGIA